VRNDDYDAARASKDFSEAGGRPRAVVTGRVRIGGDVGGWQSRIRMVIIDD
jgi:hypothetical protein